MERAVTCGGDKRYRILPSCRQLSATNAGAFDLGRNECRPQTLRQDGTSALFNSPIKLLQQQLMLSLEDESRQQVHRVVAAGIAIRAVVVRCGAVESRIAGILGAELKVLHRPI